MRESILKNGLKIITEENKNSKVSTVSYLIKAGSYNEFEHEHGIAHLTEHLLFKGTPTRNFKQISEDIENIGGYLNAETDNESTRYYCTVPSDKLSVGLDVMTDMVFNSIIPEDEFEKEKKVVKEELKMYMDDPGSQVIEKLYNTLFKEYHNRQSIGGTVESVSKISRDDVIDFIDRNYFPKNMVLVVNGGNADHDEICEFVEDFFDKHNFDFIEYEVGFEEFNPRELNSEIVKFENPSIQQNHLCFGAFGPSYFDKDKYALTILANILGGNATSKLYSLIREEKGLAYTVYSTIKYSKDCCCLTGYAGLNNEDSIENIVKYIEDVIINLKTTITKEEVENSKTNYIGLQYIGHETTSSINSFVSYQTLYDDSYSFDVELENIKNVTYEDVIKVAEKYLNKENLIYVSLGK